MTTELEQEFFKVFGIEPKKQRYCDWQADCPYSDIKCGDDCPYWKYENELKYPEITDRKLLQLLCIYNDMQGCVETCITPCKYEDTKEMILSTLVYEKFAMIDCDKGTYMDVMTKQIQQLFKEEV